MKRALLVAAGIAAALICAVILSADWASSGGNPQRDGWAQGEEGLSRKSAANGDIRFLYSYRLDAKAQRMGTPVMLTNLIGWKGFKALVFIGGNSDVYAVDYALGRPYFKTHLDYTGGAPQAGAPTALCPGGITGGVVIAGNSGGLVHRHTGARGASGASGASGAARPPSASAANPGPNVWVVGADGELQTLRQQDGNNKTTPPVKFLPPNSRSSDLNIVGDMVYTATRNECGGAPNALYAVDLSAAEKKVVAFPTNGSGFAGSGGVAVGSDGDAVYGLIPDGSGSVAGRYSNTVVALDPKDLTVKDYFTPAGAAPVLKKGSEVQGATPAVFTWEDRDLIVTGGTNGRIYLLDSGSLGGPDHHTPLAQSDVFAPANGANGLWNAFATWEEPGNVKTRWIYASVSGPLSLKFPNANGPAPTGSIVAFRVEDRNGKPVLTPQWSSRDLVSPAAPAVANGLVFALSTGQGSTPENAVLYALDSSTGREIWSGGSTATSYATGGIAVNASTVLFATHDSQLQVYGIPIIF